MEIVQEKKVDQKTAAHQSTIEGALNQLLTHQIKALIKLAQAKIEISDKKKSFEKAPLLKSKKPELIKWLLLAFKSDFLTEKEIRDQEKTREEEKRKSTAERKLFKRARTGSLNESKEPEFKSPISATVEIREDFVKNQQFLRSKAKNLAQTIHFIEPELHEDRLKLLVEKHVNDCVADAEKPKFKELVNISTLKFAEKAIREKTKIENGEDEDEMMKEMLKEKLKFYNK